MANRPIAFLSVALLTLGLADCVHADVNHSDGVLGHWPLRKDGQDLSGNGLHGRPRDVVFGAPGPGGKEGRAARFEGRTSVIDVADHPKLRLGTSDFSIAVWAKLDKDLDDHPGDILSKFDPVKRQGFNFGVLSLNCTTSRANTRNVYFGIDNGHVESAWTDCGRPGNGIFVMALAVHGGHLFAGNCEPGKDEAGHVYRYASGQRWIDCGSPDRSNAVSALASFQGNLYAGTAKYRVRGSALAESLNTNLGGRIYRYERDGKWVECGEIPGAEAIACLAEFKGKLYASSLYSPAVYRYEGGSKWVSCGPGPKRVQALAVFNGHIYGTSYDGPQVYRYVKDAQWEVVGVLPETTQTYGFAVHDGRLHVSNWPKALVYRYEGEQRWTNVGRLGSELEAMGLAVHNGKLYGGTLPLAEVHRFDGDGKWTSTGQLDRTPDVKYRRAWTMATYQGRLYVGTLPSGRVYSLEAGQNVTHDNELPAGWHHLAAVRAGKSLRLYVDGKQVAQSALVPAEYDLSCARPLRIGFGGQDYFNGSLSDLRLYRRALADAEIATLAQQP